MALSDLNFNQGRAFEKRIKRKYGVDINHHSSCRNKEFILVVEVLHSKIRINQDSVGLILQACLGGKAKLFKVVCLQNMSFKFCVSSREVGYAIIKDGNIKNSLFNIGFLFWNHGGLNYKVEFRPYQLELEKEWTTINRNKNRRSYAQEVQSHTLAAPMTSPPLVQ